MPSRQIPVLLAVLALAGTSLSARAAEKLRIGTETDNPPFSFEDQTGGWQGFDIDLGDEICRRLNRSCVWVGLRFDELIPALLDRRIDAALSEISVTPARAARVIFTRPVTDAGGILVVPFNSDITDDTQSMRGAVIGVQSGTTNENYARAVIARVAKVRVYPTQEAAFDALLARRIDATLCDMETGQAWLEDHAGSFRFADQPIDDPAYYGAGTAIALPPGEDQLRAQLDYAIGAILRDGTFQTINRRYFSFSIAPGSLGAPL